MTLGLVIMLLRPGSTLFEELSHPGYRHKALSAYGKHMWQLTQKLTYLTTKLGMVGRRVPYKVLKAYILVSRRILCSYWGEVLDPDGS